MGKKSITALAVISILFSLNIFAQNSESLVSGHDMTLNYDTILKEYIYAYNEGNETALVDEKIQNFINSLPENQKESFNTHVLNLIGTTLEQNHFGASLSLINLYQAHSPKNNKMMPMLYYIKGNIYTSLRDTTGIKEAIKALSEYKEGEEYLEALSNNLNSIRSYRPNLKDLAGYWVSSVISSSNGSFVENHSAGPFVLDYGLNGINPIVILHNCVLDDSIQFTITKNSAIASENTTASLLYFSNPSRKDWSSQMVIPFSQDSIYIAWCNENLLNKSTFVASLMRTGVSMAAEHISGKLNKSQNLSSVSSALGDLGTMAAEVGINSLITHLFTTKKRLLFTDARLKILNSHVMEGQFHYKRQYIDGDGNSGHNKEDTINIRLYKWEDPKIVFEDGDGFNIKPILHEGTDENVFKKDKSTNFAKYRKESIEYCQDYNFEQIRQIMYQDYCSLKEKGINVDSIFPKNINKPSMGIECFPITSEFAKRNKLKYNEGLFVIKDKEQVICDVNFLGSYYFDVRKVDAPGCLYGIKKNDIIVAINGHKVRTAEDAFAILENLHPTEIVEVKVNRNDKELSFCFPLSFYYKIQPQISNYLGTDYMLINAIIQEKEYYGAKVLKIKKDSPAKQAQLQKGDIIISINGHTFKNHREMINLLNQNINEPLTISFFRKKQKQEVTITPVTLYTL